MEKEILRVMEECKLENKIIAIEKEIQKSAPLRRYKLKLYLDKLKKMSWRISKYD